MEGWVKVGSTIALGRPETEENRVSVGLVAQGSLQLSVRFRAISKPLEGVRDANAQGTEALAVAPEGYFKGRCAVDEVVEEVTPAGGVSLSVCPSWCHCRSWMLCPKTFLSTCVNRRLHSLIFQRQSTP